MNRDDSSGAMKRFIVHAATIMVIVPALIIYEDLRGVVRRVRGLF